MIQIFLIQWLTWFHWRFIMKQSNLKQYKYLESEIILWKELNNIIIEGWNYWKENRTRKKTKTKNRTKYYISHVTITEAKHDSFLDL